MALPVRDRTMSGLLETASPKLDGRGTWAYVAASMMIRSISRARDFDFCAFDGTSSSSLPPSIAPRSPLSVATGSLAVGARVKHKDLEVTGSDLFGAMVLGRIMESGGHVDTWLFERDWDGVGNDAAAIVVCLFLSWLEDAGILREAVRLRRPLPRAEEFAVLEEGVEELPLPVPEDGSTAPASYVSYLG